MSDNVRERQNIYLAGPLFSEAERRFNTKLKGLLEQYVDVYLPQEDGGLLVQMISKGMPVELAMREVFHADMTALHNCDAFIIIYGRTVDEGAAFELGCVYTLGKPCYGLKIDPQRLPQHCDNPMIRVALRGVFTDVSGLVSWAKAFADEGWPALIASSTQRRQSCTSLASAAYDITKHDGL